MKAGEEVVRIVIVRSGLETVDSRILKTAQTLATGGHHVTILSWDREHKHPRIEDKGSYEALRFRFRAPYGLKALIYWPIWWGFEFLWLLRAKWDVVHAIDFDTLLPAMIAARIKKRPVIYEMFEVYEDLRPLPQVLRKVFVAIDKVLISLANAVIIVDEARIEELNGIPNDNVVIIYNSPPDVFQKLNHPTQRDSTLTLLYAGGMRRKGRGNLDRVFQAIKNIDDVRLVIGGYGKQVEEIEKWVNEEPSKVQFLGRLSYAEVLERTMAADLLLALYPPTSLNIKYTTATKLFEAMMCSKPILVSRGTATADVVEKENCGVVVDGNSVEEIRKAIIELREDTELCKHLGENGRRAYEQKYSGKIMEQRLLTLYQELSRLKS